MKKDKEVPFEKTAREKDEIDEFNVLIEKNNIQRNALNKILKKIKCKNDSKTK